MNSFDVYIIVLITVIF